MMRKNWGFVCKQYRNKHGITLRELGGDEYVQRLSAFEHGRSSNINLISFYLDLAFDYGEKEELLIKIFGGDNER